MNPIEIKLTVEFGELAFRAIGLLAIAIKNLSLAPEVLSDGPGVELAAGAASEKIVSGRAPAEALAIDPAAFLRDVIYTPERIGLATELQALGHTWLEIFPHVNALPGKPCLSADALKMKFNALEKAGELPPVSGDVAAKVISIKIRHAAAAREEAGGSDRKSYYRAKGVWSDERIQLMTDKRTSKTDWDEIALEINKLPGPKCSGGNAVNKCYFKLKAAGKLPPLSEDSVKALPVRPAAKVVVTPPPVVKPRAAAVRPDPPAHLAAAGQKIVVNMGYVRQWAVERGLCNGGAKLDIPMVNKKRRDLGLPEFELDGARA